MKISKELLSDVLNYEVDTFLGINKNEIDYTCCRDENEGYIDISINIYEFAYKCKEWSLSKGYILSSNNYNNGGCCQILKENEDDCPECGESTTFKDIHSFTEIEAIFKACEWLQENIK